MIRTSKHILSNANQNKIDLLNKLYIDYKDLLQSYVDMIINKELPLKTFLSTKKLPNTDIIKYSQYKAIVYKQASEIVKSSLKKVKFKTYKRYKYLYAKCKNENKYTFFTSKRFNELNINYLKRIPKIEIKNISIPFNEFLFNLEDGKSFDEFIRITTPYPKLNKKSSITLNIPLNYHRQSNKFIKNDWKRKKTIELKKINNQFFFNLFWEKEDKEKNQINKVVGIDLGYKKLISSSSGIHYGLKLNSIYDKISRKQQGSKKFKRALIERNELINYSVKEFIQTEWPNELIIENLKHVKNKTSGKIHHKTMNKLQRWSYNRTINKLNQLSESEGFIIKKVDPAYTSQTCSNCGNICKESRKGEIYECVNCNMKIDADYNAAMNILKRGEYGPSPTKKSIND